MAQFPSVLCTFQSGTSKVHILHYLKNSSQGSFGPNSTIVIVCVCELALYLEVQ